MFGKHSNPKQDVLLLTETGDIVDMKLDADVGYVEARNSPEAWGLNRTQQARRLSTGRYVQLISERSGIPIRVFRNGHSNNKIFGGDISTIAKQAEDRAEKEAEKGYHKDSRIVWLGIALTIAGISFLIVLMKVVF